MFWPAAEKKRRVASTSVPTGAVVESVLVVPDCARVPLFHPTVAEMLPAFPALVRISDTVARYSPAPGINLELTIFVLPIGPVWSFNVTALAPPPAVGLVKKTELVVLGPKNSCHRTERPVASV